ncbi:MAG: hypothetical protein ACFFDQ_07280 [Candidatus Thorarchaeota archaeon]
MRRRERRTSKVPRRRRLRVVKGLVRIGVGTSILYHVAGTNRAVKLQREDVQKLETDIRKYIEEMNLDELEDEMNRLMIKPQSLTDDENHLVMLASKYVLVGYFLMTPDESSESEMFS